MTVDEAQDTVANIVEEALRVSDQVEHVEIMEIDNELHITGEFLDDVGQEIYASLIVELI